MAKNVAEQMGAIYIVDAEIFGVLGALKFSESPGLAWVFEFIGVSGSESVFVGLVEGVGFDDS